MIRLLDSSVVIGLLREEHEHHPAVEAWLTGLDDRYATCPITQGAFVRLALQRQESCADAVASVASLLADPRHVFWPDDLPYSDLPPAGVVGHRQVTDGYLAQLTRRKTGRVATLDRAFAAMYPDVAELVPTS